MTQREALQSILADGSVQRASALRAAGIRPQAIANALNAGVIVRTGTGAYYQPGTAKVPELVGLATACSKMPQGIVCLMSAAYLCDLIDEPPDTIWLALPVRAHEAKAGIMPQRIVRWSYTGALEVGIVDKEISGIPVRFTGPARTIVDLLRYGGRLGHATAGVSALRRYLATGGTVEEVLIVAELLSAPRDTKKVLETLASAFDDKRTPQCATVTGT